MQMIERYEKPFSEKESLDSLNIFIRKWFESRYSELTPPQRYSFKLIKEGKNLIITAPTGSGKTFSAFTAVLSDLMDMALQEKLGEKIYCLYVSPLRALNNDIYRNLSGPLEEIYKDMALPIKRISVGIRTGDTPQKERQRQLRSPPNILVTTPESLAIILNSERFSESLNEIRYLIIDELHELAGNKRGVHLSLSVERLEDMVGHGFVRIGLGATLHPLENAARFLVGYEDGAERQCHIIDATWEKRMEFKVVCPVKDIINASDKRIEAEVYGTIDSIIKRSSTTLIFTNTRSGTERVVYHLMERFKYTEESIAAHHGSLSRETRLGVEELLKNGKLKCVVSSTSLELGVDIGYIDNVVQIGSAKSVARTVQRIGRSGHGFRDTAKGDIVVTNRDDLVECAVMLDAAKNHRIDSFTTPMNALDVLSQHLVGMSQNRKWSVEEAYRVVKRAYPYRGLGMDDFKALLEYLSGGYVGLESRRVYGKLWYEESEGTFGRRGKLTKLIYFLNIGTIPDEVAIDVFEHERWIGSIEEEFLSRLKPGDVFTLGGRPYRFESSRVMKCYVKSAAGENPTIPPWFSEQLPLTFELALEIGRFRGRLSHAIEAELSAAKMRFLKRGIKPGKESRHILDALPADENARLSIYSYFVEQLLFAGAVPNEKLILIEKSHDAEESRVLFIFHALYGRRVNDALSRIIAIRLSELYDIDVGISIGDNGFVVFVDEDVKLGIKGIISLMKGIGKLNARELLEENIKRSEMLRRRFRYCAARSFMILRNYKGKKISVRKQQINSQLILKTIEEEYPGFPILKEAYREIFEDLMDLPHAEQIIREISEGTIKYKVMETDVPSPFSHMMITLGETDVIMMKDRRKRIRRLHRLVMQKLRG